MLFLGLFAASSLSAQEYRGPRSVKKDWKAHKKDAKISKKMFRDRSGAANRKRMKARKKYYKMEMKEDMHK